MINIPFNRAFQSGFRGHRSPVFARYFMLLKKGPSRPMPGLIAALALAFIMTLIPVSSPAAYADDDKKQSLESRMARLEKMLEMIIKRLDDQEDRLSIQEIEVVEEVQRLVTKETAEQIEDARQDLAKGTAEEGFVLGGTRFKLGGYLKLDHNITRYSDGAPATASAGRDFYIPSTLPVGDESAEADWANDFNPRETRINLTTESKVNGKTLKGVIELDFLINPLGNERISNSYAPRMRHAYIEYEGLTVGQAWTTWMDLSAMPETLDFVGPTEAMNFNRQPLIRYKMGNLEVALEQPETTITDPVTQGRVIPGTDTLPDLIARYRHGGDWGHLQFTGMLRNLTLEEGLTDGAVDDATMGYGFSTSGLVRFSNKDDFRFLATMGEGLGRYNGQNVVNAATVDANGRLDTIGIKSAYAAYRHHWTKNWRSSLVLGYFKADHPDDLTLATDEVKSFHGNIIFAPTAKWKTGIEYIFAEKSLENGLSGTINRFQLSTKYVF